MTPGKTPFGRAVHAQQTSACIHRQVQALLALRSAPVLPRSGCRRGEKGCLKNLSSTQVQLAQTLGISQSTVNAYELGHRRVPVSTLPLLARTLGVSVEELLGEDAAGQERKRGRTPKLMQHMERINALPKTQQKFVMQMIEMALAQAATQAAAR